ncbi:MAG: AI-2E family transporter [Putridiphycobacter sp.]|nr:AI-2E family transporter [Putridiphycobacter sp.]
MLAKTKTTNILLLFIVVPLVFFLLKTLSFIFIPLIMSMFISVLFLPLMRWLKKRGLNKTVSIIVVVLIIIISLQIGLQLIQLSSREILSTQDAFLLKAEDKLTQILLWAEGVFGIDLQTDSNQISQFLNKDSITASIGPVLKSVGNTITMALMTAFFTILWLAESINVHQVMHTLLIKQRHASIKTFIKIEDDLITFIKVKFFVSLGTGIFTGLACYFFDVSFPIFWGIFAFVINFIQMIGSFVTVIMLSIFALVELDPTGHLAFFIITITGVQVLFGSILEPVFMGKSFSINIITVLVMLMFWGFIWGVPGMILSIPITVFIKIILEQFKSTRFIAEILAGQTKV